MRRVGPRLTPAMRRALNAELLRLEREETLPSKHDFEALLTPPAVGAAFARQVPNVDLWVMYRIDGVRISLCDVFDRHPVRVDE